MLMLITLLNDGTLISIGYDNVKASPMPLSWNLPALYTIAASQVTSWTIQPFGVVDSPSKLIAVY
jgi:hypothetical protein